MREAKTDFPGKLIEVPSQRWRDWSLAIASSRTETALAILRFASGGGRQSSRPPEPTDAANLSSSAAMRFWWVNQNQTYRQEVAGGYLWSPKLRAYGTSYCLETRFSAAWIPLLLQT